MTTEERMKQILLKLNDLEDDDNDLSSDVLWLLQRLKETRKGLKPLVDLHDILIHAGFKEKPGMNLVKLEWKHLVEAKRILEG